MQDVIDVFLKIIMLRNDAVSQNHIMCPSNFVLLKRSIPFTGAFDESTATAASAIHFTVDLEIRDTQIGAHVLNISRDQVVFNCKRL